MGTRLSKAFIVRSKLIRLLNDMILSRKTKVTKTELYLECFEGNFNVTLFPPPGGYVFISVCFFVRLFVSLLVCLTSVARISQNVLLPIFMIFCGLVLVKYFQHY